jgi:hypothetical protein
MAQGSGICSFGLPYAAVEQAVGVYNDYGRSNAREFLNERIETMAMERLRDVQEEKFLR